MKLSYYEFLDGCLLTLIFHRKRGEIGFTLFPWPLEWSFGILHPLGFENRRTHIGLGIFSFFFDIHFPEKP